MKDTCEERYGENSGLIYFLEEKKKPQLGVLGEGSDKGLGLKGAELKGHGHRL